MSAVTLDILRQSVYTLYPITDLLTSIIDVLLSQTTWNKAGIFSPILRQQAQQIFRNIEFRKKFLILDENFLRVFLLKNCFFSQ